MVEGEDGEFVEADGAEEELPEDETEDNGDGIEAAKG